MLAEEGADVVHDLVEALEPLESLVEVGPEALDAVADDLVLSLCCRFYFLFGCDTLI